MFCNDLSTDFQQPAAPSVRYSFTLPFPHCPICLGGGEEHSADEVVIIDYMRLLFLNQETKRYKDLIKTPMDLSIVKKKLESNGDDSYSNPEGFVADVRLIFSNCTKYYKVNIWTMDVTILSRV